MNNEVYFKINGKEALEQWGVYMSEGSLTALMTPPSNKEYITSECVLEHGRRVLVRNPKMQSRDVSLTIYVTAHNRQAFLTNYDNFCQQVLAKGVLDIETRFQPGVVYHCVYNSCSQFTQYDGRFAQFVLKLEEPDPSDRTYKEESEEETEE